jgi:hypothetical protein
MIVFGAASSGLTLFSLLSDFLNLPLNDVMTKLLNSYRALFYPLVSLLEFGSMPGSFYRFAGPDMISITGIFTCILVKGVLFGVLHERPYPDWMLAGPISNAVSNVLVFSAFFALALVVVLYLPILSFVIAFYVFWGTLRRLWVYLRFVMKSRSLLPTAELAEVDNGNFTDENYTIFVGPVAWSTILSLSVFLALNT